MSDLISRQAAIDEVLNLNVENRVSWRDAVIDTIDALPSAQQDCTECAEYDSETKSCPRYCDVIRKTVEEVQPERKTGRWIPLQLSIAYPPYQCSCCFKNAPMIETGCLMNRHLEALLTHFCPNCGADMRGKGEK